MDIHYNPSEIGLSPSSYFPYYLNITDAYSHMCFMIGMQTMKTSSVMEALMYYAQYYKPHLDYTLADVKEFHADAGSVFTGNDFMNCLLSSQCPAVMCTAAPHHQEQNGLAESRWRIVRSRATSMLTHA
jgi:transposase InsO family protein